MHDRAFTDEELLDRLNLGLEQDYIAPWFQPVMDPTGTVMHSAEALPRFIDPEYGVIAPATFLELANRHGILGKIGEVLLTKTCAAHATWTEKGIAPELVTINLTGLELQDPGTLDRISASLKSAGIKPSNLGIEVAESVAYEPGWERAVEAIGKSADMGVKIIIDDLGSGAADPENLKKLRASCAKIDRMTVSLLDEDDNAVKRVSALAQITSSLGIPLIAKGVETRAQIDLLVDIGCEGQQGFAIARPMPLDSFTEWLDLNTTWDASDSNAA
ncbi:MAG: EAL domain-containing protein [Pseudomonadota bacterium]